MSFGAKHECARLKEELASVHAQLNKIKEERDALADTLKKEWQRYEILRTQYGHKALQYESVSKDRMVALTVALNIRDQHTDSKCKCPQCTLAMQLFKEWTD